jgi:uncharacterized paraquat-inducible protein A
MPLQGKCPTDDCSWHYDVHAEIKKGVERQSSPSGELLLCPNCQETISSRLTVCQNCGYVIVGSKSYQRRNIFVFVAIVLIVFSLIARYIFFLK